MVLESAFAEMAIKLTALDAAVQNARWVVVQGQPEPANRHALVDHYEASLDDIASLVAACQKQLAKRERFNWRRDWMLIRQMLLVCQQNLLTLSDLFCDSFMTFERHLTLFEIDLESEVDWSAWVEEVNESLHRCVLCLRDVALALLNCWQAFSGTLGPLTIFVQLVTSEAAL